MTIEHHPAAELLTDYATGLLAGAPRAAVATHCFACAQCRRCVTELEHLGGEALADLPLSELRDNALERVRARLPSAESRSATEAPPSGGLPPLLPPMLRRQAAGRWRRIAPGLRLQPLAGPDGAGARLFLLEGRPGTRLLAHSHRGLEMSCVLSGGFSHDGGHFGPGDFDIGDQTSVHRVAVDPGEDCVALIVLEGKLRLTGVLGRLLQPFLRL